MAIDTHSKEADKIANLYRAAFYIAKGACDLGLEFTKKQASRFQV